MNAFDQPSAHRPDRNALLADYAAAFLARRRHSIKASTEACYRNSLAHIRSDRIARVPLAELRGEDVEEFEAGLFAKGLSATSVAHVHAFLGMVLKHAVAVDDLEKSPLRAVKAPRARARPVNALTPERAREVMARLRGMGGSDVSVAARVALLTGMRRGELCALRWQDVDLGAGVLRVAHALTHVPGGFALAEPKDTRGNNTIRQIPICRTLAEVLRRQRARQEAHVEAAGGEWGEGAYVLGDPVRGGWKSPDGLTIQWGALVRAEGWRGTQGEFLTFHDLRHTFATLAVASGMDVMCLASILGHRDAAMTLNIYSIALAGPKRAAMALVDEVYAGLDENKAQVDELGKVLSEMDKARSALSGRGDVDWLGDRIASWQEAIRREFVEARGRDTRGWRNSGIL